MPPHHPTAGTGLAGGQGREGDLPGWPLDEGGTRVGGQGD